MTTTTTTAPRLIHLLVGLSAQCEAADATYASSNPNIVTCPACLGAEPEPAAVTTPAQVPAEVTTPEELRAWRLHHKLSQRGLARLLDVTGQTVMRWEQGAWPIPRMASYALAHLGQRLPC